MSFITKLTLIITLVLSIIIPFGYFLIGEKNKKRYKKAIGTNVFFFFGAFVIASIMMYGGNVQAASETAAAGGISVGLGYIAAALGAISEDSSVLGKSLIFVGLAEGVCLYGLIISFMILGKL